MITHEDMGALLKDKKEGVTMGWGTVKEKGTGTLSVALNGSVNTDCAALCDASVGDRVLVAVFGKSAVVLGKKVG